MKSERLRPRRSAAWSIRSRCPALARMLIVTGSWYRYQAFTQASEKRTNTVPSPLSVSVLRHTFETSAMQGFPVSWCIMLRCNIFKEVREHQLDFADH
jgi:hypothetical protein